MKKVIVATMLVMSYGVSFDASALENMSPQCDECCWSQGTNGTWSVLKHCPTDCPRPIPEEKHCGEVTSSSSVQ
jgi:hypothetical protein